MTAIVEAYRPLAFLIKNIALSRGLFEVKCTIIYQNNDGNILR